MKKSSTPARSRRVIGSEYRAADFDSIGPGKDQFQRETALIGQAVRASGLSRIARHPVGVFWYGAPRCEPGGVHTYYLRIDGHGPQCVAAIRDAFTAPAFVNAARAVGAALRGFTCVACSSRASSIGIFIPDGPPPALIYTACGACALDRRAGNTAEQIHSEILEDEGRRRAN